jgi:hypothetical protein
MHVALEIASAFLAAIPIASIAQAYRTTPSMRLALALIAFLVLEAKFVAFTVLLIASPDTLNPISEYQLEVLEFADDVAVMMMFAVAFLWGTRWSPERVHAEHA